MFHKDMIAVLMISILFSNLTVFSKNNETSDKNQPSQLNKTFEDQDTVQIEKKKLSIDQIAKKMFNNADMSIEDAQLCGEAIRKNPFVFEQHVNEYIYKNDMPNTHIHKKASEFAKAVTNVSSKDVLMLKKVLGGSTICSAFSVLLAQIVYLSYQDSLKDGFIKSALMCLTILPSVSTLTCGTLYAYLFF